MHLDSSDTNGLLARKETGMMENHALRKKCDRISDAPVIILRITPRSRLLLIVSALS